MHFIQFMSNPSSWTKKQSERLLFGKMLNLSSWFLLATLNISIQCFRMPYRVKNTNYGKTSFEMFVSNLVFTFLKIRETKLKFDILVTFP